jgi:uncharacterized protein YrzB (UPF0473 family)
MDDEKIISLIDEEGKETEFEIIATLEVNDKEYAILLPVDSEDEEAFIFRIVDEGDEPVLECVEDDEEFDQVAAAYEELILNENDEDNGDIEE